MNKGIVKNYLMILSSLFKSNKSKIIFYHDIHSQHVYCNESSTPFDLFKRHFELINNSGFCLVDKITEQRNQIKIQLDDGYKGIYDCMPFIVRNKIPLEIFLIVDRIGDNNFLSLSQIQEMNKYDFITFSSHTVSHRSLSQLNDSQLLYELEHSKNYLEEILNQKVNSICYPKGLFNDDVVLMANKIGYNKQYCSIPGSYKNNKFSNVDNRKLAQSCNSKEFDLLLKGGMSVLKLWYQYKHYKK